MSQSRMRMRPWLESQINSKKIPGLQWLNKEEKLFQVPWKHAAKHGWDIEKDACLFKNWAIHTGRYKEGDVAPDPKTWKANFRCAMNSLPDIEEVKDKSISKGCSAVRVYRMLEASTKSHKNEKKSKSSKTKSLKKTVEDIKAEETVEATSSIQLPEDHNAYSLSSYIPEEMEVGDISTLKRKTACYNNPDLASVDFGDLSTYDLEDNSEWRNQLPDSTNDKYQIQVSPIASSDDENSCSPELYLPFQCSNSYMSNWQSANIGEKGYLINEPGKPSFFESAFQEPDESFTIDLSQVDSRPSMESSLLDSLQLSIMGPIPCSI